MPIPRTLLELVNRDFTIEREVGIGISAGGDADTTTGWGRHRRRLFAIRARPKA